VRTQVLSLQDDVKQARDLQQLQVSLSSQFDTIVGSVEKFRSAQQKRQQTSEGEIKRLREQVRASEAEAEQLRVALREQRIRATTDALTQLPNRHAYHDRLHQEYARWRRYRGKLSLVLCDIDFFKQVNDQHGHAGGDVVLKHLANIIRGGLRESDFAARFGGEEFVLLMPETNLVEATKAVNKLRQRVASQSVTYEHNNIAITVSFGVAEFEGEDVPRDVFERADKALYRAKVKGRNQVNCERKGQSDDEDERDIKE
jgi:diguanylate cyclase